MIAEEQLQRLEAATELIGLRQAEREKRLHLLLAPNLSDVIAATEDRQSQSDD